MYMNVVTSHEDYLHLSKTPGFQSLSIFIGIFSLGVGASFYGPDPLWIKLMYVVGSAVFGLTFLDEWEDFVADRSKNSLVLRRATIFQKLLGRGEIRGLNVSISDVMSVRTNLVAQSPQVVLVLSSGMQVAISEGPTNASRSEIEMVAAQIESFFKLNRIENVKPDENESSSTTDSEHETGADADADVQVVASLH